MTVIVDSDVCCNKNILLSSIVDTKLSNIILKETKYSKM